MRISIFFGLVVVGIVFLSGCSENQVKNDASFSKSNTDSLLVFGVLLNTPFPNPIFAFRKYDPLTGKASLTETFEARPPGSNWLAGGAIGQYNVHNYFVLKLPAGHWFLEYIQVGGSGAHHIYSLNKDALAFKLSPGESAYIGEYYFYAESRGVLQFDLTGNDLSKAEKHLKEYKNISSSLINQAPTSAEFDCIKKRVGVIGYVCKMESAVLRIKGPKAIRKPFDMKVRHL